MTTKLYIFGDAPLFSVRNPGFDRWDLERDLENLILGAGEVIWDGDEHNGPNWNLDLLLYDDAAVDIWIRKLVLFFKQWGVTDRSISFTIVREAAESSRENRRIEVAAE